MVDSQVDYGIQLEADSVVNWNIDVLFDVIHDWPYPLPLAPRHPDDPMNYARFLKIFHLNLADRTIPYVHAQFSWNYRAYPFLRHALALMRQGYFKGANFDETGINILLWQAKANHTLCQVDPYFDYLSEYEGKNTTCQKYCHKVFILLHGGKQLNQMRNVFERLKTLAGSPPVLTENSGLHYLNETYYTCCYPGSRPSSIHPLLCEQAS
ncbi:unnamed protein product [Rotaria sp. Silwood1]|nr:unnamed protein product [Rotaria sp. Silwood1]CAF4983257.1 unnamed protein product [Rotaria sp. Silwood1]CAF5006519.1 unnamed protein product [Rotaria sp. Silwood1]